MFQYEKDAMLIQDQEDLINLLQMRFGLRFDIFWL